MRSTAAARNDARKRTANQGGGKSSRLTFLSTNRPYEGGHSAEDCSVMIQAVLQDRWLELHRQLSYSKTDAERILAGALADYLDERFSITDGRTLGWLKAN